MIYEWKEGARMSKDVNPQVVGETLDTIRSLHGGITAALVVEEAEPEHSPLHPAFEWDNATAAHEWRLHTGRHLLRSIVIRSESEPDKLPIRAFVVVNIEGDDLYTSTTVAMSDTRLRQQVLARALKELDIWDRRYREIEELANVFEALDRAREVLALR